MSMNYFQATALKLFQKLKIIAPDLISSSHLDYQIPLEKHLDEYRELLYEIEHQTHFFTQIAPHWSKQFQQYRTRPKPPFLHTKISLAFAQCQNDKQESR
ncbi:hypothetical protein WM008_20600 [Vibrio vulnificus]|uniref:hypothetical protein n=1 Tax=Vibrio vulnificus TaxID=672 RepID=UPI00307E1E58